jgi:hypothetical protein
MVPNVFPNEKEDAPEMCRVVAVGPIFVVVVFWSPAATGVLVGEAEAEVVALERPVEEDEGGSEDEDVEVDKVLEEFEGGSEPVLLTIVELIWMEDASPLWSP